MVDTRGRSVFGSRDNVQSGGHCRGGDLGWKGQAEGRAEGVGQGSELQRKKSAARAWDTKVFWEKSELGFDARA